MDEQKETWAFVVSAAGQPYVGRIVEDSGEGKYPTWVTLDPCFDYVNDLQFAHGPQGQTALAGRLCALIPHDHCIESGPVHVRVSTVQLVDEMGEHDRKKKMSMIAATLERMEQERLKLTSNLVLASSLPKGMPIPNAP